MPGYYGLSCSACPNGTYKTEVSNADCLKCLNMPLEALETAYYTMQAWKNPLCPYECYQ